MRRPDDREVIGESGYLGMEKHGRADPERVSYSAVKRTAGERSNFQRKGAEFD